MNAHKREYLSDPIDLAIIIVSYNVRDLLRRCLQSIDRSLAESRLRYTTIVVDNASHDGSDQLVRSEFPHVELIQSERNLGFAGGNNVGLRRVMVNRDWGIRDWDEQSPIPDPQSLILNPRYVLLLNPDTEIVSDALDQMVRYGEEHPDVAVIGPQLRYGNGTLQSSRRRFPSIATLFWESTLLGQWWPSNPWARRYHLADRAADQIQTVDWLVGAALLVRSSAIEQAGLLDERFFMYSEELEWQARLGRYGRIVYLPSATITHYEGKSSEQNLARRHINFNRSKLRYAAQRWGTAIAILLRVFLLLTYLIQLLIEAGKWLLGHKRELRRQRIVQYGMVLRSGL